MGYFEIEPFWSREKENKKGLPDMGSPFLFDQLFRCPL